MKKTTAIVFMALTTVFVGCNPAGKTNKAGAVYATEGDDTGTSPGTATSPSPNFFNCSCESDLYSCTSFNTRSQAQACYDHCQSLGLGDIHRLDTNGDGKVCENLP